MLDYPHAEAAMTPNLSELRAAVERAAVAQAYSAGLCLEDHQSGHAAMLDADVARLRSLVKMLDGAQEGWRSPRGGKVIPYSPVNEWPKGWRPVLILPIVEDQ